MSKKSLVDEKKLFTSNKLLRALAHPLRLTILSHIHTHGECHVNGIYKPLELEQSVVSQHLRILRAAKLVKTERRGKFIFYRINMEQLVIVRQAIDHFDQAE